MSHKKDKEKSPYMPKLNKAIVPLKSQSQITLKNPPKPSRLTRAVTVGSRSPEDQTKKSTTEQDKSKAAKIKDTITTEEADKRREDHYNASEESSDSDTGEITEEKSETESERTGTDPELADMKQQLLETCDKPELGRKRSEDVEKAVKALNYLQVLQHRCRRLPASTSKGIDRCVEIVYQQIVEMEVKIQAADARIEILETYCRPGMITTTQGKDLAAVSGEVDERTQTRTPRGYAEAVKAATSTLIVQATEDRDAEDIEKQIKETTLEHHDSVKRMKRIKSGVKIICENEKEAQKIKQKIDSNPQAREAIKIKTASIRKKKVMIFNIPEFVTEEQIKQKLKKTLGLGPQSSEDEVTPLRQMAARNGMKHQPVLLPEPLADHLLKAGTVCLGFKDCPIKAFVSVTRCHKCLEFDHVAAQCKGPQRCTICAGEHLYSECRKSRPCCYVCTRYNEENSRWRTSQRSTDHQANSSSCWVHRTLLRIRQIQMEKGMSLTTGYQVIHGRVSISTFGGKDRIEFMTHNDHVRRQKDKEQRSRYHGPSKHQ